MTITTNFEVCPLEHRSSLDSETYMGGCCGTLPPLVRFLESGSNRVQFETLLASIPVGA